MKKLLSILLFLGIFSVATFAQSETSGAHSGHEWVDLGLSVKWATRWSATHYVFLSVPSVILSVPSVILSVPSVILSAAKDLSSRHIRQSRSFARFFGIVAWKRAFSPYFCHNPEVQVETSGLWFMSWQDTLRRELGRWSQANVGRV